MKRFVPDWQMLGSPLARRLIFAIILVSSAITFCLTAFQLYGEYRSEMGNVTGLFRQIQEVHLQSLTQFLWDTSEHDLQLQLDGIARLPNVDYIAVREGEKVWAQAGRRVSRDVIERQYPMTYEHRGQTLEIGVLTIVAGLDAVYSDLVNRAFIILASNALKTFLVAGFALAFFQWLVTRHLLAIADFLRHLDPGGRWSPLILARPAGRRPDEIDEVAASLNRMLDAQRAIDAQARESEESLRLTLVAARMGTFDWDIQRNRIIWSPRVEEMFGYAPGEFGGTYEAFSEHLHHDDLPGINAEVARCIAAREPFEHEYRIVWPDGSVRWVYGRGEFAFGADGQAVRMRGAVVEITERKRTEQGLRNTSERLQTVSRKLLVAQEDERRTVARELHDEVGGVLTAVKLNLQALRRSHAGEQNKAALADSMALVDGAIQTVRSLSHDLRPALLDDLGLIPALKWYGERQSRRAGVAIELALDAIDLKSAPQLETACFRIVQESVTNVLRHASARRIQVVLRRSDEAFALEIADDGSGFDVAAARKRAHAGENNGLSGMEERASLLGGRLNIESAPGAGTRVLAEFALIDGAPG